MNAALPTFPDFPGSVETLTPAWLTKVFRASGLDVDVHSFTFKQIGTGQVGENNRIVLKYSDEEDAAGVSLRDGRPRTIVCKFASKDADSKRAGISSRTYLKERLFYHLLAPRLRDRGVKIAHCWAAEFCPERGETILVMEDLSPAEQGDQIEGITVAAAEAVMRQAARIHGAFYNSNELQQLHWMDPPMTEAMAGERANRFRTVLPGWIARYGERVKPEMAAFLDRFANVFDKWLLDMEEAPRMLQHADFRIDNLLFRTRHDGDVEWSATVDWQTYAIGSGGFDVGYCLGSGLLREDRRAHEKRLVKLWHEELCREACLADYSFQEAWHHYKLGHLTGVTMAIMAAMHVGRTERGDEMFWAMAIRHYEALQDLDLDALLARYEV